MHVWMLGFDFHDGRVIHVIIMIVRDHHGVYDGNVLDLTRHFGVPLWPYPAARTAPFTEDWIEQYSEPTGKLNKVAGMAQPRGA